MSYATLMYAAAILGGLALALGIWGGRDLLMARYRNDVEWLRQTWLRFRPDPPRAELWVVAIYVGFASLLLTLVMLIPSTWFAVLIWVVILALPRLLVEVAWQRRRQRIDQQLPGTIATMCNSIRAGLTLVQAMQRLAEQAPEPIRTEFRIMANRYTFGANLELTINEAKQRLKLPNFNLFASALLMNREMGGDVADTLNRISLSLDKLHQMRKTVEAHTAEGRTNIKVLLAAPVFMLLMLSAVDPEGVKMLFSTPQGYGILILAALLIAAGIFFARRVTQSEV